MKKMMFNGFLSVCSQLGLSNAGHFLGWQLQIGLKYLVQAPGPPRAERGRPEGGQRLRLRAGLKYQVQDKGDDV